MFGLKNLLTSATTLYRSTSEFHFLYSNLIRKVYGAILLYTWSKEFPEHLKETAYASQIFFASQATAGSCATQAIVSVLLNQNEADIGENLKKYKEIAITLDPKVTILRTIQNL